MTQDEHKKAAAEAAISFIQDGMIIGIGTGSTVNYLIEALKPMAYDLRTVVSSSTETTERLNAMGIEVTDLNSAGNIDLYIDGADEVNARGQMIKGGGGALTREKILASAARKMICIADPSKKVDVLGAFPLPIEVLPMARSFVAREIVKLGGQPILRENFTTDNGNLILDVNHLNLTDPKTLETQLNQIPGAVCNGIFAHRPADQVIIK